MTWARAVWIENDVEEEGVLPKVWIEDKTVRWPTGVNVMRAFTQQKIPEDNWESFPLVKVKLTSEDVKACEEYDFTTGAEVSDEVDVSTSRSKRKRSVAVSKNCSSGSLPPLPRFRPSLALQNGFDVIDSLTKSLDKSNSPAKASPSLDFDNLGPSSSEESEHLIQTPKRRKSQPGNSSIRTPGSSRVAPKKSRKGVATSDKERPSASPFPMPEARFQKRVLHLLTEIRDSLQRVGKTFEPADSAFHLEQLKTKEEFCKMEEHLRDVEKKVLFKIIQCRFLDGTDREVLILIGSNTYI
ncbi:Hypothetical predicted protein [Paramuricea clavata]|uniref:Uncharacterized protein n=1 Tax=Paramuricea clavata TaxID=317549 RepID=A0A6S7HE49_PARCT|nr:Hypothetical predicted protein [Paramuricea clavata]